MAKKRIDADDLWRIYLEYKVRNVKRNVAARLIMNDYDVIGRNKSIMTADAIEQRLGKQERLEGVKETSEPNRTETIDNKLKSDSKEDELFIEITGQHPIKNIDDAIKHSKVDLDKWEIERHIFNSWETSMNTDKGVRQVTNIQVKLWFRLKRYSLEEFRNDLLKAVNSAKLQTPVYKKQSSGVLLEIDIFDSHIGKLSVQSETGENYNMKIAEERHFTALEKLLNNCTDKVEKILYPIGNDWLHIDDMKNMTTGGTAQDVSARWHEIWIAGRRILIESILRLRQIAPVEVIRVPANHDFENMFYMGDLLQCYFDKDKHVNVDNSPKTRKYYTYGKNGICFTHGNEEKASDLPLIVMRETQKEWGHVEFIEIHTGHFHGLKNTKYLSANEQTGITTRALRSLSSTDAWHYKKGYVKNLKGCEAFVWDKDHGLVNNLFVNWG